LVLSVMVILRGSINFYHLVIVNKIARRWAPGCAITFD